MSVTWAKFGFCPDVDCFFGAEVKACKASFALVVPFVVSVFADYNVVCGTYFSADSVVKNSMIADGCKIEGTVENSILFRGVKVGKGAIIENCVLMEGTVVGRNSILKNVITDRFVKITDNQQVDGKKENSYIGKNSVI